MALVEEFNLLENAFEDQQEQNMRLQQQLKEKDDANFKLLSEKIKVCEHNKRYNNMYIHRVGIDKIQ